MAGHGTGTPRAKGVNSGREARRGEVVWCGHRRGGERRTEREMEKGDWRDGEGGEEIEVRG